VNGNELRPLHVPVRLLGQERQIDRVRKPRIEELNDDTLGVRRQIVLGLVGWHDRTSFMVLNPSVNR
jgi:hypothetical protein